MRRFRLIFFLPPLSCFFAAVFLAWEGHSRVSLVTGIAIALLVICCLLQWWSAKASWPSRLWFVLPMTGLSLAVGSLPWTGHWALWTAINTMLSRETEFVSIRPGYEKRLLDSAFDRSFLSVRSDWEGRLFVGCRESLLAYEPEQNGGWSKPRELYRFPADSWLNDIAIRGDDLYVTTSSALYRLAGARVQRRDLKPERLIWGIPLDLHVSMHSMAWGPEGDLYFTAGDPFLDYGSGNPTPDHWGCWTLYHGTNRQPLRYCGTGGVFRCRPDGSDLKVVATGLRGPFGLAFDPAWNLFTDDNDHESRPERFTPARLLQVVSHADFNWPRGWLPARDSERSDILPTVCSDLGPCVPVGMTFFQSVAAPQAPATLLMSRWDSRAVSAFQMSPAGSVHSATEDCFLAFGGYSRPLCCETMLDGTLVLTLCKMMGNGTSPHYPSELWAVRPQGWTPAARSKTRTNELYDDLAHPLWVRRYAAHQELIRRGPESLRYAVQQAREEKNGVVLAHLAWLAALSDDPGRFRIVEALAAHSDPSVRLQAIRVFARFPEHPGTEAILRTAARDPSPSVRLTALAGMIQRFPPDVPGLKALQWRGDAYLTQLAGRWLSALPSTSPCFKEGALRLIAVLAAGYQLTTPIASGLPSGLLQTYPKDNAELTVKYADETVNLASLAPIGCFTTADWWRRRNKTGEDEAFFALVRESLHDPDPVVSAQAAYFLSLLNDPRAASELELYRSRKQKLDLAGAKRTILASAWVHFGITDAALSMDVIRRHEPGSENEWNLTTLKRDSLPLSDNHAKVGARQKLIFWRITAAQAGPCLFQFGASSGLQLCVNDRIIHRESDAWIVQLEPGSNDIVLGVPIEVDRLKISWQAKTPTEASAPKPQFRDLLSQRLTTASSQVANDLASSDPDALLKTGNAERGRQLFSRLGLGCVRCHAIVPGQSGSGAPSLVGVKKKYSARHLADSILFPDKDVEPAYRTTTIVRSNGTLMSGLVVQQGVAGVTLLMADGQRVEIPRETIEEQYQSSKSPMPSGLVQSKTELADLLAYLTMDAPPAP